MFSNKKVKLSTPIEELPINPNLIQKLKEAHIFTFEKILQFSDDALQRAVKVTEKDVKIIKISTSLAVLESDAIIVHDILNRKHEFSRNKFSVDLLKNNYGDCDCISTRTITEIYGESGCGKTQICMHFSILAQLPVKYGGLGSSVIYIHSEGDFPIKRFMEMATAFKTKAPHLKDLNLSDNLILKKVSYLKQVVHVLQNGISELMQRPNSPKVIILDSVAALLRCEYESQNVRTAMIQEIAFELWKLANRNDMVVICVNQISGSTQTTTNSFKNIPALGLLWSTILTTRIRISRDLSHTDPTARLLEIIFSAYHPRTTAHFSITSSGIA